MNENKNYNLSVLVLVRNHEKFVEDCANSIKKHLSAETPIVIVDTGSIDKSVDIFQSALSDSHRLIKVVQSKSDTSTLENVHLGVKKIKTTHFILLSADDALGSNYGIVLRETLGHDSKHNTVYNFRHVICDANLNPLYKRSPKWTSSARWNEFLLSISNPGTTAGSVLPTQTIIEVFDRNPIPNTLIEDYWLWWRLVKLVSFQNLNAGEVLYRSHQGSVTLSRGNTLYAKSLGFSAAMPMTSTNNIANRVFATTLIPRWIRHLDKGQWKKFIEGYWRGIKNGKI